jgi:NADPH:quinone reductase-like Zn-dependent oxidoreductase
LVVAIKGKKEMGAKTLKKGKKRKMEQLEVAAMGGDEVDDESDMTPLARLKDRTNRRVDLVCEEGGGTSDDDSKDDVVLADLVR